MTSKSLKDFANKNVTSTPFYLVGDEKIIYVTASHTSLWDKYNDNSGIWGYNRNTDEHKLIKSYEQLDIDFYPINNRIKYQKHDNIIYHKKDNKIIFVQGICPHCTDDEKYMKISTYNMNDDHCLVPIDHNLNHLLLNQLQLI